MIGPFLYLYIGQLRRRSISVIVELSQAYTLLSGFEMGYLLLLAVLDGFGDPSYGVLDASWNVAIGLMRSHAHEHVWEMLDRQAQVCPWSVFPLIAERFVICPLEVDGVECAGNCEVGQSLLPQWQCDVFRTYLQQNQ